MIRFAFTMKLKPGMKEEYKRRHDALWPEMVQFMKDSGILYYSIFLDEPTNTLFAVQYMSESGKSAAGVRENPLIRKWSTYMSDIVESDAEGNQILNPLPEMFHFQRGET